jgi:hypothetical protein
MYIQPSRCILHGRGFLYPFRPTDSYLSHSFLFFLFLPFSFPLLDSLLFSLSFLSRVLLRRRQRRCALRYLGRSLRLYLYN